MAQDAVRQAQIDGRIEPYFDASPTWRDYKQGIIDAKYLAQSTWYNVYNKVLPDVIHDGDLKTLKLIINQYPRQMNEAEYVLKSDLVKFGAWNPNFTLSTGLKCFVDNVKTYVYIMIRLGRYGLLGAVMNPFEIMMLRPYSFTDWLFICKDHFDKITDRKDCGPSQIYIGDLERALDTINTMDSKERVVDHIGTIVRMWKYDLDPSIVDLLQRHYGIDADIRIKEFIASHATLQKWFNVMVKMFPRDYLERKTAKNDLTRTLNSIETTPNEVALYVKLHTVEPAIDDMLESKFHYKSVECKVTPESVLGDFISTPKSIQDFITFIKKYFYGDFWSVDQIISLLDVVRTSSEEIRKVISESDILKDNIRQALERKYHIRIMVD